MSMVSFYGVSVERIAKPALMLGMENACSKGPFNTLENSLLDTTKFILENERLGTAFA